MTMNLTQHRDGKKYGVVTNSYSGETVEYRVQVQSMQSGKYVYVNIVGGDIPVYVRVGMLVKRAVGRYDLKFADQQGRIKDGGYTEHGKIADLAETLVHNFLASADHAKREAAKTPEQKATEAAEMAEAQNAGRNQQIAKDAVALMDTLDRLVPSSTAHYAVEDARKALATLIRHADKGTIQTEKGA